MVLAIFTLLLISTLSLIASMIYGYMAHINPGNILNHVTIGFPTTLIVILTHCIAMFYFIGSGKTLKEAVATNKLSQSYNEKAKSFKMITSPLQTYTMMAVVVMACLGGATQVGKIRPIYHEITAWLTLILHFWTTVQTVRCVIANQLLGNDAVEEIAKLAPK